MLNLKVGATLTNFRGRKQFHGDNKVLAVTIHMRAEGVPIEQLLPMVAQLSLLFDKNDQCALPEVPELPLGRDVSNVEVKIGTIQIKGADVTDVVLTPQPGRKCDLRFTINAEASGILDALHGYLDEKVGTKLVERQAQLSKLEGGLAPEPQERPAGVH